MVIYIVYCENCKTNEKINEIAFRDETDAIEYVNRKSNEYKYVDWYYDYTAIQLQDVPDTDVGE